MKWTWVNGNLLNMVINFLETRKQRVVFHRKFFCRQLLKPESSSSAKLFPDETSLFSVAYDVTAMNFDHEVKKRNKCVF